MSFFNIVTSYDEAWKAIIMPPRQEYTAYDLGPTDFSAKGSKVSRTDFRLLNKRGHVLECSFFQHDEIEEPVPCVVYLHGNGCSRLEALAYSHLVLSNKFSFFCFDFSGCGKSEGQYTSVGWFEQEDLECILQYIYKTEKVSKVAIWGRSMGAVTALYHAEKDPRISCIVVDSAFTKFKRVVKELAKEKASIPGFITAGAFGMIRKTVTKKAKFDIGLLRPIKHVHRIKVPALFGTGEDDSYVSAEHTKDLYAAYGGKKELMIFEGDHNSDRPVKWCFKVMEFLNKHLNSNNNSSPEPLSKLLKNYVKTRDTSLRSTTESLNELNEERDSKKNERGPRNLSSQAKPKGFSWLDYSPSSPQISTKAKFPNFDIDQETIPKETVYKQNTPNDPLKKTENKFQPSFINHKNANAPAKVQLNAQVSYTVEPILKTTHETPKFGLSKPIGNGSLNELPSHCENCAQNQGRPHREKTSQPHSLNDIDTFYSNKTKYDQGWYTPGGYKSESEPIKLSYGQNISGPGTYLAPSSNPQPKSYQVGDTPQITLGSPIQTFSDAYRGYSDSSTGRHADKHTPSSTKSYMSGDQSKSQGAHTPYSKVNATYVGSDYGFNSIANNRNMVWY